MPARYEELHQRSLADPAGFWGEAAKDIDWIRPWDVVLDDSRAPLYRWFAGGELNTCWNAIDRHVEGGRADQPAIIYDSPVTGTKRILTYRDFRDQVALFAGALRDRGVVKGDRVLVYMPMVPEALVAMLACARLGAVHSVVFGGFAPHELATRINDAQPKVIVSASCGIEPGRVVKYKPMLDSAIEQATHKPESCLILQRPQEQASLIDGRDHDWEAAVAATTPADCVPVAATDPLYILYTSGTTGQPKGVVRDNGGHAVALKWTMEHFYGVKPGEVFWAASDVGWVVGHSYIVYAPLLHGCTTVIYEGKPVGTPDAGAFWRMISEYRIQTLFTAPTAFRAIKRDDPNALLLKNYDVSCLRALFLAGERSDPDTLHWAEDHLKVPVIDHWWQTETGWPIAGNPLGLGLFPVKYGSTCKPLPGWDVRILGADGHEVKRGDIGAIVCKLPLPPGTLATLWNAEDRFRKSYLSEFSGYYQTADAGFVDADGYVYVMARTDDIINVAGHRLSTGGMEEVLAGHPDVAECAVIGVADQLKGQVPLGFVVLKAGVTRPTEVIVREIVAKVRDEIGPVASFKQAIVVDRLPKTRSGKILRGTMQKIADAEPWKMPATIDDPMILEEIGDALRTIGYAVDKPAD
ncbi:propionyl-CoA synthetase [Rhodospirillum centenum]|uniref:Propionate--CoA ligase n=1 Tax=Rhodospirillum centenum (strain ATCC 51521 / SW) TaxID=414684 RepID=B6INQ5_RHOCS|nr:propionyl-CoA synthetase [Rhodospirillum centenum]ACI99239.1 propionate--CoA ligase [Rhodospirillum centenum SW]